MYLLSLVRLKINFIVIKYIVGTCLQKAIESKKAFKRYVKLNYADLYDFKSNL